MTEIEKFARLYFQLGFNVTCISKIVNDFNAFEKNIQKAPNHKSDHLVTNRQTKKEFNNINWENASGVGTLIKYHGIKVLDIDGCNDYRFIEKVLRILELPINYEWVVKTGSNNGYHIILNFKDFFNSNAEIAVKTYPPKNKFKNLFNKIEILWDTHLVLPSSQHQSGNNYEFVNCDFPKEFPEIIKYRKISEFIDIYLKSKKMLIGRAYGVSIYEFKPIVENEKNKLICVLDIDTDGLIQKNYEETIYPNIVQIAWILLNKEGKILKNKSAKLFSPDITFSPEKENINDIFDETTKYNISTFEILTELTIDIQNSDILVSHNTDFTLSIIKNETLKFGIENHIIDKSTYCTMKETVDYCKIPNKNGGYKYPKLSELQKKLFLFYFPPKNNAENDVKIISKCFLKILKIKRIELDEI